MSHPHPGLLTNELDIVTCESCRAELTAPLREALAARQSENALLRTLLRRICEGDIGRINRNHPDIQSALRVVGLK